MCDISPVLHTDSSLAVWIIAVMGFVIFASLGAETLSKLLKSVR